MSDRTNYSYDQGADTFGLLRRPTGAYNLPDGALRALPYLASQCFFGAVRATQVKTSVLLKGADERAVLPQGLTRVHLMLLKMHLVPFRGPGEDYEKYPDWQSPA